MLLEHTVHLQKDAAQLQQQTMATAAWHRERTSLQRLGECLPLRHSLDNHPLYKFWKKSTTWKQGTDKEIIEKVALHADGKG